MNQDERDLMQKEMELDENGTHSTMALAVSATIANPAMAISTTTSLKRSRGSQESLSLFALSSKSRITCCGYSNERL